MQPSVAGPFPAQCSTGPDSPSASSMAERLRGWWATTWEVQVHSVQLSLRSRFRPSLRVASATGEHVGCLRAAHQQTLLPARTLWVGSAVTLFVVQDPWEAT